MTKIEFEERIQNEQLNFKPWTINIDKRVQKEFNIGCFIENDIWHVYKAYDSEEILVFLKTPDENKAFDELYRLVKDIADTNYPERLSKDDFLKLIKEKKPDVSAPIYINNERIDNWQKNVNIQNYYSCNNRNGIWYVVEPLDERSNKEYIYFNSEDEELAFAKFYENLMIHREKN